jgi:hypothetical protein
MGSSVKFELEERYERGPFLVKIGVTTDEISEGRSNDFVCLRLSAAEW